MKIDKGTLRGVAGVVAALAIIFAIHTIRPHTSTAADYPCNTEPSTAVEIDIHSGETGSEIAIELFNKGVVASSQSFFRLAVADERAGRIAPGLHRVDKKICAQQGSPNCLMLPVLEIYLRSMKALGFPRFKRNFNLLVIARAKFRKQLMRPLHQKDLRS